MGNLDGIKQVEAICSANDRDPNTPLNSQVWNARSAFDKRIKDSESWIPGKGINADQLRATLDTTLNGLTPQIREDARAGCLSATNAIKEATGSLASQQLVDGYVLASKASSPDGTKSTASNDSTLNRMFNGSIYKSRGGGE